MLLISGRKGGLVERSNLIKHSTNTQKEIKQLTEQQKSNIHRFDL